MRNRGKLVGGGAAVVAAAALYWALSPDPVAVDIVAVARGPMTVTVADEGITQTRNPYLVTAPLGGTTTRAPVEVGDRVEADETVVAILRPASPELLDARSRLQAEAAVTEAAAALRVAEFNLERARGDLDHAEAELRRNRELSDRGVVPLRMLEDFEQRARAARTGLEAAEATRDLQQAALERARANLVVTEIPAGEVAPGECCARIRAPVTGTVLALENPSARVVQAGAPLLTIGNLDDLEIEVDLLSTDAVRVAPGARARVERWGGESALQAHVRRVDPAAFTRVSALGIEEQRVPVVLDFDSPPEARRGLGEGFRVFVSIVIWEEDDVLQVPQSALFRQQGSWAVFRVQQGRAVLTPVEIGQRHDDRAQVLSGLEAGAMVIAYPGTDVSDGTAVAGREDG